MLQKEQAPPQSHYRLKLLLFLLCTVATFVVFYVGYSALNTLSRLDVVEAERDRWQRPAEVIQALNLTPGDRVVDLGCGSGYFALKLSSPVGPEGRVIAEDIHRLPLTFVWMRGVIKGERNVRISLGGVNDPHLPRQGVNAVLISNTFHEFTNARSILAHVSQALVPGGRLVIVDRAPNPINEGTLEGEHEISPDRVEAELRQANFEIVSRQDHFIESDPDQETWWLIVTRNP